MRLEIKSSDIYHYQHTIRFNDVPICNNIVSYLVITHQLNQYEASVNQIIARRVEYIVVWGEA